LTPSAKYTIESALAFKLSSRFTESPRFTEVPASGLIQLDAALVFSLGSFEQFANKKIEPRERQINLFRMIAFLKYLANLMAKTHLQYG
jgi:hypothetical protein